MEFKSTPELDEIQEGWRKRLQDRFKADIKDPNDLKVALDTMDNPYTESCHFNIIKDATIEALSKAPVSPYVCIAIIEALLLGLDPRLLSYFQQNMPEIVKKNKEEFDKAKSGGKTAKDLLDKLEQLQKILESKGAKPVSTTPEPTPATPATPAAEKPKETEVPKPPEPEMKEIDLAIVAFNNLVADISKRSKAGSVEITDVQYEKAKELILKVPDWSPAVVEAKKAVKTVKFNKLFKDFVQSVI